MKGKRDKENIELLSERTTCIQSNEGTEITEQFMDYFQINPKKDQIRNISHLKK